MSHPFPDPDPTPCLMVTTRQLPLSCPLPQDVLWNKHPKVYLPIAKTGRATCPYCGTTYVLEERIR
ncbi:zinc-finger domain-containing protein [Rickettsiella massiliensis]|uniref:zinc-finger domain-containing protein n=1 Tax=Rickettsiella massiliensis TaxID=676517 RepID=UPI0005256845